MAAAAHATTTPPPGLALFMAATRQQESGDYQASNGQGAYQILPSNWPSWAQAAGQGQWADVLPSQAPAAVQDAVARYKMTSYYYGPAGRSWRKVARIWNGGSPSPVPNPALGAGATTDTYATQVLDKMAALPGGAAQANITDAVAAGMSAGAAQIGKVDCYVKLPSIGVGPSVPLLGQASVGGICLDPLIFSGLIMLGVGGFLAGAALLVVIAKGSSQGSQLVTTASKVAGPLTRLASR